MAWDVCENLEMEWPHFEEWEIEIICGQKQIVAFLNMTFKIFDIPGMLSFSSVLAWSIENSRSGPRSVFSPDLKK